MDAIRDTAEAASIRGWLRVAAAASAVLVLLLVATAVPAPFTVDEGHYLASLVALRDGGLTLGWSRGLPASRALLAFDPNPSRREVAVPVAPTVPPLWAFLAFPFSALGWRGLVALNALAALATAWLVGAECESRKAAVSGAAVFLGAGFVLEYAQGVWPHCLSAALTFGAFALARRAATGAGGRGLRLAVLSGVTAGIACGVRYPNVAVAAGIAAALVLLAGRRRLALGACYALGVGAILVVSSSCNWVRFGSLNPISKGPGYLSAGRPSLTPTERLADSARTAWLLAVDHSARPRLSASHEAYMERAEDSRAILILGVPRKALLQSVPWVGLLVVFGLAGGTGSRTRLAALALPPLALLAALSLAGSSRTAGLCLNERYLFDVLPFAAAAAAPLLAAMPRRSVLVGLAGGGVVALILAAADSVAASQLMLYLPLGLVVCGCLAAVGRWRGAQPVLLGACLGWAGVVHLADDLPASRAMRDSSLATLEDLRAGLGPTTVLWATTPILDAALALPLERPLAVLEPTYAPLPELAMLRERLRARGEVVTLAELGLEDHGEVVEAALGSPWRIVGGTSRLLRPVEGPAGEPAPPRRNPLVGRPAVGSPGVQERQVE